MFNLIFRRLIDYSLLEAYLTELISSNRKQPYLLALEHVARMFTDILNFLRVTCSLSDVIRKQLLQDEACLKEITRLLSISCQGKHLIRPTCTCTLQSW